MMGSVEMNKKLILFLDEVKEKDLPLVGGKGLNLGIMINFGFPVPTGFCVTTLSYKEFIEHNSLEGFLEEALQGLCQENIGQVAKEIRERIMESQIPKLVEKEIINAINKMGPYNNYAVRSSATAEDMKFASFAGQQDTYLNVHGIESILHSVKSCWASLFTDRAILYRIQNNIEHKQVYMAVVVQNMVSPNVSGIMFTADPVSGHRDILTIDASYGLGEALVSGLVSPDIYKYNKGQDKIESKVIADKKLAVMPLNGGGTNKVRLTNDQSKSQVLTDTQIVNLAQLGKRIEKYYGCPQDIEWCLAGEQLYIVQSRSITSLFPLPQPIPTKDALHVYASFSHIQVMTDPISPLGVDMARAIISIDKSEINQDVYKYTKTAAGRIYIDISGLLQNNVLRKMLPAILKNADNLLASALENLINRTDFNTQIVNDRKTIKALKRFMMPIVIRGMKNLLYKNPDATVECANDYVNMRLVETQKAVNQARQGAERLEVIHEIASFSKDFKNFLPLIIPAIISYKILEGLEEKLLGSRKYVNEILQGLEGNITTEMGLLTGDLADSIRKSPELIQEFKKEDYSTLFDRLKSLNGYDDFIQLFDKFIEKYGLRAAGS
ncbi:PEP/pyruvate-binding domain-containing protein [Candidatus Syntrophocurvum alkaliphilum]|uniref:PEP/pyruvate-binding domain-containing protein n=1 Tax=Candidatus Syntrophocurvum alkaliphilum TaxID=2293317 RepID=UPI001FAB17AC|nr:PEP/pyruvate-binding domain-containing protein [Candidatus Syntrophocurvum alkaliphilum]